MIKLNCKEAARIVSQGLDSKLPLTKRVTLRFHLVMCKGCTLYQKQIVALRSLFHEYSKKIEREDFLPSTPLLSQDGRKRIKDLIKKSLS